MVIIVGIIPELNYDHVAVYFDFLPLSNTKAETPMARTNVDVLFATEW